MEEGLKPRNLLTETVASNAMRIFFTNPFNPTVVYNDAMTTAGYKSLVTSIDPHDEYLHVFFVKEFRLDINLNGVWEGEPPDFRADGLGLDNVAFVRDGMSDFKTASIVAHEAGHAIAGLSHRHASDPECTSSQAVNRNVMCEVKWAEEKSIMTSVKTSIIPLTDTKSRTTIK